MDDNKPIHTIFRGAVCLSIWRNVNSKGVFYDVTCCRRYKEGSRWASAFGYGERDLPLLAKAVMDAHAWIQARHLQERVGPADALVADCAEPSLEQAPGP